MFSPAISNNNTKINNAKPGNNANHQLPVAKYFIDSDKIIPIAGSCGDKPNHKNVTLASCMIA